MSEKAYEYFKLKQSNLYGLCNFILQGRNGTEKMFDLYNKLKEFGADDDQPMVLTYDNNTVKFYVKQLKHFSYGDWLRVRDDQGRMIAKRKCSRCGHIISNARKVVPTFCSECGSKNA